MWMNILPFVQWNVQFNEGKILWHCNMSKWSSLCAATSSLVSVQCSYWPVSIKCVIMIVDDTFRSKNLFRKQTRIQISRYNWVEPEFHLNTKCLSLRDLILRYTRKCWLKMELYVILKAAIAEIVFLFLTIQYEFSTMGDC